MIEFVNSFPKQMLDAHSLAQNSHQVIDRKNVQNIVISGLGGSGIGGSIISDLVYDYCSLPIFVNKTYTPPSFISSKTLFIASSYSGNTEETIESIKKALIANCKIVVITSGGEIEKIANQNNLGLIKIPSGYPPRACIAYSMYQIINILISLELAPKTLEREWIETADYLMSNSLKIKEMSYKLSAQILGKFMLVYSTSEHGGVITRFQQQINENSKLLMHSNIIPEMNHNELVGFRDSLDGYITLLVSSDLDSNRNLARMKFVEQVVSKCNSDIIQIHASLNSKLKNTMYLIHLFDYISVYLADMRGVDSVEVRIIDSLKKMLSGIE